MTNRHNIPSETVQALHAALTRIIESDNIETPSHDVQRKALGIIGDPALYSGPWSALVYSVQGSADNPYRVTLYTATDDGVHSYVTNAECDCPAVVTCSHMIVALTLAERDGFPLST